MLAIIGGSGLESPAKLHLPELEEIARHQLTTPFGDIAAPVIELRLGAQRFLFLSRHSEDHSIAPHLINYRANIWALRELGASQIIAVAAVGGVADSCAPMRLVLPDQLIDYTWGREQSFVGSDCDLGQLQHINFCTPYDHKLRLRLIEAAKSCNADTTSMDGGSAGNAGAISSVLETACYGATQGPRLETAAEIQRMRRDGCDIVGMTGMPEAALAMEAGLAYACIALVVNWAAGVGEQEARLDEIYACLEKGMINLAEVLAAVLRAQSDG